RRAPDERARVQGYLLARQLGPAILRAGAGEAEPRRVAAPLAVADTDIDDAAARLAALVLVTRHAAFAESLIDLIGAPAKTILVHGTLGLLRAQRAVERRPCHAVVHAA